MRLSGATTKFRAGGAGARFTEVDLDIGGEEVDLGVANDKKAVRDVDPSSGGARITARGLVDDASTDNFIDVVNAVGVGGEVDVTDLTGVNQALLDSFKPWKLLRGGMRSGKRSANEDRLELLGTGLGA